MSQRKIIQELDPAQKLYPDMPGYVATEAEFIAAVKVGQASSYHEPLTDHATVMAELRQIICDHS